MSHTRKEIKSQNSLCNVVKCLELLIVEEHRNVFKVI